ncbi:MAG: hypothetical protein IJO32_07770 [Bacilli bacterium]|nr:hypothetical protein [Bacilli bacterium]
MKITQTKIGIIILLLIGGITILNASKFNKNITPIQQNELKSPVEEKNEIETLISNEELMRKINELMKDNDYNEYAIRVINSFIPDYQQLFTNNEIYELFKKVKKITINPYDPNNPNLSDTDRAYNADGNITINCFENELVDDQNWDGLRWLLTHEIMHSLGEFPYTFIDGSFNESVFVRNDLLEEGLADSIAHYVKKTEHQNRFAIKEQNEFMMFRVDNNYDVDERKINNHTYTIAGNIINIFKYVGCYDEIIDANINSDFSSLKTCVTENVKNGEVYFDKLFKLINEIHLYVRYPNTFLSKNDLINEYNKYNFSQKEKIIDFINNNNLNNLLIKYSKLAAEIINNKIDNTYSICDFYKNNVIFYSVDGYTYKSDINCQDQISSGG